MATPISIGSGADVITSIIALVRNPLPLPPCSHAGSDGLEAAMSTRPVPEKMPKSNGPREAGVWSRTRAGASPLKQQSRTRSIDFALLAENMAAISLIAIMEFGSFASES